MSAPTYRELLERLERLETLEAEVRAYVKARGSRDAAEKHTHAPAGSARSTHLRRMDLEVDKHFKKLTRLAGTKAAIAEPKVDP